jgi:hypothetical protein
MIHEQKNINDKNWHNDEGNDEYECNSGCLRITDKYISVYSATVFTFIKVEYVIFMYMLN